MSNYLQKFVLLLILLLTFCIDHAKAHAPHDEIADIQHIELPDGYEILTIVRSNLFMSINGNVFTRIIHGLDNTSLLNHLAYSASKPGFVYMSTLGDGIYRSFNNGISWQKSNTGLTDLNLNLIKISPTNADFIIATGCDSGVYISINSGEKWQPVYTQGSKIISVDFISDKILLTDTIGNIFLLSKTQFNLSLIYTLPTVYCPVSSIAFAPSFLKTGELLVGTEYGLYGVSTLDKSLKIAFPDLPQSKVTGLFYSKNFAMNGTIYALFSLEGFYISNSQGKTWKNCNAGLSIDPQAHEYNLPEFSGFEIFEIEDKELMYICGFDGLFTMESTGKKWTQLNTLSQELIVGLAVSDNYKIDKSVAYITYLQGPVFSSCEGNKWESLFEYGLTLENLNSQGVMRMHDLLFTGTNTSLIYAISASNIYRYEVNKKSWTNSYLAGNRSKLIKKINSSLTSHDKDYIGESTYMIKKINNSNDFLIATVNSKIYSYCGENKNIRFVAGVDHILTSICVSPNYINDSTIIIGTEDQGLFRICGTQVIPLGFGAIKHLLVAFSPNYTTDSVIIVGSYSGLFKTNNNGRTWISLEIDSIHKNSPISAISLSPAFFSDSTMLISLKGFGLYKSSNGGITFHEVSKELIEENYSFAPLDYYPANSGAIKFSPTFKDDSTVFAYSGYSVFRSVNKGESWVKLEDYPFNIRKNFLMLCKGVLFEFRYDILMMVVVAGFVFVFYLIRYSIKAKTKIHL